MKHVSNSLTAPASAMSGSKATNTALLETAINPHKKYTLSYTVKPTSVHEVFKLDAGANLVVYGRSLADEG